ncbi:MAG: leucine-rich repeat protein [Muribaculaceae bacterium]
MAESFTVGKLNYETTSENTVAIVYSDDGYADLKNSDFSSTVLNNGVTYTVTEIGEYAFEEAVFSENIEFPSTITTIGECAFSWAEAYDVEFTFSKNLASIGGSCFECCVVAAINIEEGNPVFASVDGVLYSADKKMLLVFPPGKNVTQFTIPSFVERLFEGSFQSGQEYLVDVTIPATVKSVDSYAFYNNGTLESLTIESGATELGESAFMGCEGITSLSLPTGIKAIPRNCFFDLCALETLVIPEGVETIGQSAFGFGGFKTITFPSTLKEIGFQAFANCEALPEVALPESVTKIGDNSFSSCTALATIDLNNVTEVGEFAFSECTSLTEVKSKKLETIGASAFYRCTALESYVMPATVKAVGSTLFFNAIGLKKLVIGSNVETIGAGLCTGTASLAAVELADGNANFAVVDGILYNKDMSTLVAYPGGRTETAYTLPETVTTIDAQAIRNTNIEHFVSNSNLNTLNAMALAQNANLKTVKLGDKVTAIAGNTFNGCNAITEVYCFNPVPVAGVNFTTTAYANATLYLTTNEAIEAYKADANWGKFANFSLMTDGIDNLNVMGKSITSVVYYNLSGQVIPAVKAGDVVIAVRKYSDGTVSREKLIVR